MTTPRKNAVRRHDGPMLTKIAERLARKRAGTLPGQRPASTVYTNRFDPYGSRIPRGVGKFTAHIRHSAGWAGDAGRMTPRAVSEADAILGNEPAVFGGAAGDDEPVFDRTRNMEEETI